MWLQGGGYGNQPLFLKTHRSTCEKTLHRALLEEERKDDRKYLCMLALFCFLLIKTNPRANLSPLLVALIASNGCAGSCVDNKTPPTRVWFFIQVPSG